MEGRSEVNQDVCDNDSSTAPAPDAAEWLLWIWSWREGAGMANGIQPLAQLKDNPKGLLLCQK